VSVGLTWAAGELTCVLGYAFTTGLRVVVFLAHGDELTLGFGDLLTLAELVTTGVLAPVVGPPTGAFVGVAVGLGAELSLADVEGEVPPLWPDEVIGVGVMVPIPGDGDAAGLALEQLRAADDPLGGKSKPTGLWDCVVVLPDPPLEPPPAPVLPPWLWGEFALLGKIAC
jgi:hypothetical protein